MQVDYTAGAGVPIGAAELFRSEEKSAVPIWLHALSELRTVSGGYPNRF